MRISLILFILLAGCAKPNYVSGSGTPAAGDPHQKPVVCLGRFASKTCVTIAWEKYPTERDFGSFLFKTYRPNRADETPVVLDLPGEIAVVLWMPGMGHGSSPVNLKQLDIGTYRADRVFFTMRGEWEIRVQLKVNDELKDQAIIPITF